MATKLTGLMWSADAPREAITLTLANAVACFEQKFGYPPDAAYLNERQFDPAIAVAGIRLHPARNVLKNTVFVVREGMHG
ncbi:MAG: hypothetical protein KJ077_33675 [Anaerolineae bacterium]|nr:hypothetical protein [Anaerolineae bacterium]